MVALKTERQVFLWHMEPHAIPDESDKDVTLREAIGILSDALAGGTAFAYLKPDGTIAGDDDERDPKNCIFIAEMKDSADGQSCLLLLSRGDPDAANPSFLESEKGTVEHIPPKDDQVQGWSAHMAISYAKQTNGRHRACFERMPGVSPTLVQRYLESIFDHATGGDAKYTYKKMIKQGKKLIEVTRAYRIRLSVKKVPSERILEDMKKGELSSITLIRQTETYTGLASPEIVNSFSEKLTIRTKRVDDGKMQDYIRKVQEFGREKGYEEIQFQVTKLPGNVSASPRFSSDIEDAMDTLYARSTRMTGFDNLLETCYPSIDDEISE